MRLEVAKLYPHSRRKKTRFLLFPLTLLDHPSPAAGKRIQRWLEMATWEEQWNPRMIRWEAMHWLDLRDDIPDVSYMYIGSPQYGPDSFTPPAPRWDSEAENL